MTETVYKKVDPRRQSLIDDITMCEIDLPALSFEKTRKSKTQFDLMYRIIALFWDYQRGSVKDL